jgi:VanZ family protein
MMPRLKYWIPAMVMAILISLFSTHYFSSEQTARVIYPILKWFFPSASHRMLHLMHVGIRKLAHISEFGVFSITVFLGVRGPRPGWKLNWAAWTLLIAIAYAGLDEWHQSFVPLREPSVRDVFIDSFGALLAQVVVFVYAQIHSNSSGATHAQEESRV